MNKEYEQLAKMKVTIKVTTNGMTETERVPQRVVRHYARKEYEMVRNALLCADWSFLLYIAADFFHDSLAWIPAVVGIICLIAGVYSWRHSERMLIQAIDSDTRREFKRQVGL